MLSDIFCNSMRAGCLGQQHSVLIETQQSSSCLALKEVLSPRSSSPGQGANKSQKHFKAASLNTQGRLHSPHKWRSPGTCSPYPLKAGLTMIYGRKQDALAFKTPNSQLIFSVPAVIMSYLSQPVFPLQLKNILRGDSGFTWQEQKSESCFSITTWLSFREKPESKGIHVETLQHCGSNTMEE